MRRLILAITIASALSGSVPGGLGSATAQELTGNGEWQSLWADAMRGTWSVELRQTGGTVGGTIRLTGSNIFNSGNVTGSIDGSAIVLGVMVEGTRQATFSGRLIGESISGEWECPAIEGEGVWFGTLRARAGGS